MSGTGDVHFDAALDEWRAGRSPNPRPAKRRRDKNAGRAKCLSIGSECRICGVRRMLERHHLVPRSQSGEDRDENLVPLCGPFENACHQRVTENDPEALSTLRSRLYPEEEAYIVFRMGQGWLDRRYPLPDR